MKSVLIDEINHLSFHELTPGVNLPVYLGNVVLTFTPYEVLENNYNNNEAIKR